MLRGAPDLRHSRSTPRLGRCTGWPAALPAAAILVLSSIVAAAGPRPDRHDPQVDAIVGRSTLVSSLVPAAHTSTADNRRTSVPNRGAADYQTTVWGQHQADGLDSQRRLDRQSPGFASAIEVGHQRGARSADALAEVVARAPGATVRSIGGLGQFSSVSLRGSSGQQVALFLDGVPLGSSAGSLVGLADLSLEPLKSIQVFRGYVPAIFGGSTIGGAINLVSDAHRGPPRLQASAGIGSFGARQVGVAASRSLGRQHSLLTRYGYSAARGNFPFYDTNRTPLVASDDTTSRRSNNHYRRHLGQLRLQGRLGQWRYTAQQLLITKQQGVPGSAQVQSRRTSLGQTLAKTIFSAKRAGAIVPTGKFSVVGGLTLARRRFRDPDSEVGLAVNDESTTTLDAYVSPRLRLPLWRDSFATVVVDARAERVRVDNRLSGPGGAGDALRRRTTFGAAIQLEQFLWSGKAMLVPVLRLDLMRSRFRVPVGQGKLDDQGRNRRQTGFSPRLGGRLRLLHWLEVRGSVGRYFRPPTVLELFGDQGFSIGNEGLVAEKGTAVDAGIVVTFSSATGTGAYLQAAAFATWSRDLIQWIRAGPAIRAINVEGARVIGGELGLSAYAWSQRLQLHTTATLLHSRNDSREQSRRGQPLPGRPARSLFLRLAVGDSWTPAQTPLRSEFFAHAEHVSGNFLDPSGRVRVPGRTVFGAGIVVTAGLGRLALEVRNLADTRSTTWTPPVQNAGTIRVPLSDFIGYPLPGRSLWLTLRLDHRLADGD